MSLAIQKATLIDQNWLNANRNTDAKSLGEQCIDYAGQAIGAQRILSVIKDAAKLTPNPLARELSDHSNVAISGLGVVSLPLVTKDAYTALIDLRSENGTSTERKIGVAVRDAMDAVSTWGNAVSFVLQKHAILDVMQFTELTSDMADFGLSVADYSQAEEYEAIAEGDVKKAFSHTKNYFMLRVAKAVMSVAAGILAIVMFLTGVQLLSTVAMIFLSITSAALAIRRDIFKDEGEYRIVEIDSLVRI